MRKTMILLIVVVLTAHVSTAAFAARSRRGGTVRTEHSDNQKDVTGKVTAVNLGKGEIVVNGQVFSVPRSAKITINSAPSPLMQIKVGDQATISYTIHTSTTIRSNFSGRGSSSKSGSRSSKSSRDSNTGGKDQSIEADSVSITW